MRKALLFLVALSMAGLGSGVEPGWRYTGGPEGGTIDALAVDPLDPSHVLAAEFRGLWVSHDGGRSWTLHEPALYPVALAFSPTEPGRVWAAGWGLQLSEDAGRTWSTGLTMPDEVGWVQQLIPHPTDPQALAVGSDTGVAFTVDGGATWTTRAAEEDEYLWLAVLPRAEGPVAVVAAGVQLLVSDDWGASWDSPPPPCGTPGLPTAGRDALWIGCPDGSVWRSADGRMWVGDGSVPGWFPVTIHEVGPGGTILAQLFRELGDGFEFGLARRSDAGWLVAPRFPPGLSSMWHAPVQTSEGFLLPAIRRGPLLSADGGFSWRTSARGMPVVGTSSWPVIARGERLVHPSFGGHAVFSRRARGWQWVEDETMTRASGYLVRSEYDDSWRYRWVDSRTLARSSDGGASWEEVPLAAGGVWHGDLIVAPGDAAALYAQSYSGEWQFQRSLDAGSSWQELPSWPARIEATAVDRRNPLRLLARTWDLVLESVDGGLSWTEVLTADHFPGIVRQSAADPDLWIATGRSTIWISEDDAASWSGVTAPASVAGPGGAVITFASLRDRLVLGDSTGTVESRDLGVSWSEIPAPAGLRVHNVALAHDDPYRTVIVGTSSNPGGVWFAELAGSGAVSEKETVSEAGTATATAADAVSER